MFDLTWNGDGWLVEMAIPWQISCLRDLRNWGMAIFHPSEIDEFKSIPWGPQRILFEYALAVEASNHYRKESKNLSSFLELTREYHDTTN